MNGLPKIRTQKLTGRAGPNESIEAADEFGDELVHVVETSQHLDHICTWIGIFLVEYGA
jgi:hypothetical protein